MKLAWSLEGQRMSCDELDVLVKFEKVPVEGSINGARELAVVIVGAPWK